jgi:xanthine dehydrogenase accessory factor
MSERDVALVKGGGDLGTGVALCLHREGYRVIVTELAQPLVVRRTVAMAAAVHEGRVTIEGVVARRVEDYDGVLAAWKEGHVPVIIDPTARIVQEARPLVLVDAIMAKRNTGTVITDAPIVVALGPGFNASVDCHAAIETQRGPELGRVYVAGATAPDSGVPGQVGGEATRRVMRAPVEGTFAGLARIGDHVQAGDIVASVNGRPVVAQIAGVVRGLLADRVNVQAGVKVGDIDPRDDSSLCYRVSDKAWRVGQGVLSAIQTLKRSGVEPSG